MKLIPLLLLIGMLAVSGWAYDYDYRTSEPYSAELVQKAEAGDAVAQYDLGACFVGADGVTKDVKKALKWWTKSAEQGYAPAECLLGRCYLFAMGIKKDEMKAVKWLTKAADQGNAEAKEVLEKIKAKQ